MAPQQDAGAEAQGVLLLRVVGVNPVSFVGTGNDGQVCELVDHMGLERINWGGSLYIIRRFAMAFGGISGDRKKWGQ